MQRFATVTPLPNAHPSGLPFRRFDVVDEKLTVVLSGPSAESLAPASARSLEPELAREVRSLLNERRLRNVPTSAVTVGLIDLDYGVRILERSDVATGHYLICTERIALRGPFDRLVKRLKLSDDEALLARLLVGGYDPASVALRLGTTPHDAEVRTNRLIQKAGVATRRELLTIVLPQVERRRTKRRAGLHWSAS